MVRGYVYTHICECLLIAQALAFGDSEMFLEVGETINCQQLPAFDGL